MEIVGTDLIVFPQGHFGTHHHTDQHEFHYLLEARGKFSNGGTVTPLAGSTLVYSPPLREHGFLPTTPSPQPIYHLRFRPEDAAEALLIKQVEKEYGTRPRSIPQLAPTFESIRHHARLPGPHARKAAEYGLLMLLHAAAGGFLGRSTRGRHTAVESALAYLEGSLEQPVSFGDVVARSGLTPEGFARLFRRETGETVLGYLRRRRLENARFYLETTDESIHHLALRFQFCDEFHFSKSFKKFTGHSPKSWRGKEKKG